MGRKIAEHCAGGAFYGKDLFDRERYEQIRDIAAEMISYKSEKIDSRGAIFKDDKILLVKEKNGTWSLPGGWVDVDVSVKRRRIMRSR